MAELPKRYDPNLVEPKWYRRWVDDRDFVANAKSSKPPFSIVMPPPNITGVLTLGHVFKTILFMTFSLVARECRAAKCFGCLAWITLELEHRLPLRNICAGPKTKRATILVATNFYGAFSNGRRNMAGSSSSN